MVDLGWASGAGSSVFSHRMRSAGPSKEGSSRQGRSWLRNSQNSTRTCLTWAGQIGHCGQYGAQHRARLAKSGARSRLCSTSPMSAAISTLVRRTRPRPSRDRGHSYHVFDNRAAKSASLDGGFLIGALTVLSLRGLPAVFLNLFPCAGSCGKGFGTQHENPVFSQQVRFVARSV